MQVRFTRHAHQRMIQQRINERDVLDTLESPDDVIDGDMGETIAVRRLRYDELRVVYEEWADGTCLMFTVIRTPFIQTRE